MGSNKQSDSYIKRRFQSFIYAVDGLKTLLKDEPNARIHLSITIIVIILGFLLKISHTEWLVICLLIALVFGFELINSAIENICDKVSAEWNPLIKKAKDLSAGAVLIAAVISLICGIIIFFPKICDFF